MVPDEQELSLSGSYLDFDEMDPGQLQTKLFELLTLVETSRDLLRAEDPEDVARRVLLSAIGVLGASSACVLLYAPDREQLELRMELGLEVESDLAIPLSQEQAEAFSRLGPPRPFALGAPGRLSPPVRRFLRSHRKSLAKLEAAVACPLPGREGLVGFMVLGRRLLAEGYGPRDLELFASLAELYVLALDRFARFAAQALRLKGGVAPPRRRGDRQLAELRERYEPLRKILGESEAIRQLFDDLVEFADSRATILVQGESGTGKELVAQAIHELSRRKNGNFEVVDCSSIPPELIESELFGHVKGAFTGAIRDRKGAFDLAHGGTIFLDEIGDMNLPSQTRLLRVLQEGKFRPVGGEKIHSVDVRVVVATNVDLREAVRNGAFRKDLFYRIQVFPVRMPPLRERNGDVEVLLRAFLGSFYEELGRKEPLLDTDLIEQLQAYTFPGNVRELQNISEALAIRSRHEGRVHVAHLQDVFRSMNIGTADGPAPQNWNNNRASARPALPRSSGELVVESWRENGFNLLEASRQMRAQREEGDAVPVVDRAQMSHYLDGEILRVFLEEESARRCAAEMGLGHPLRHRAEKRVSRLLEQLETAAGEGKVVAHFPRLPEEYRAVVDQLEKNGAAWIARAQGE